jgi:hypothetical protein
MKKSIFLSASQKLEIWTKLTSLRTTKEMTGFGAANMRLWDEPHKKNEFSVKLWGT